MYVIKSKNMHTAATALARKLIECGKTVPMGEKNIPYLASPESVLLDIDNPLQQVIFSPFDDPFKRFAKIAGTFAPTNTRIAQDIDDKLRFVEFLPMVQGLPLPNIFGLELMAKSANKTPGRLEIMSGVVLMAKDWALQLSTDPRDLYANGIQPFAPTVQNPELWQADLKGFLELGEKMIGYKERFFRRVAGPLFHAWRQVRAEDWNAALDHLKSCEAADWRLASEEWIKCKRAMSGST